jgi:hypothetical protein
VKWHWGEAIISLVYSHLCARRAVDMAYPCAFKLDRQGSVTCAANTLPAFHHKSSWTLHTAESCIRRKH